jgi:hypothetical protein
MLGSGPAGRQAITPSTGASGERTLHSLHHSEFINERKDTVKFCRMQKKKGVASNPSVIQTNFLEFVRDAGENLMAESSDC